MQRRQAQEFLSSVYFCVCVSSSTRNPLAAHTDDVIVLSTATTKKKLLKLRACTNFSNTVQTLVDRKNTLFTWTINKMIPYCAYIFTKRLIRIIICAAAELNMHFQRWKQTTCYTYQLASFTLLSLCLQTVQLGVSSLFDRQDVQQ